MFLQLSACQASFTALTQVYSDATDVCSSQSVPCSLSVCSIRVGLTEQGLGESLQL